MFSIFSEIVNLFRLFYNQIVLFFELQGLMTGFEVSSKESKILSEECLKGQQDGG